MALNRTTGVPAYRQIAGELRNRILAGDLGPGDRLPTEHELAARYGVERGTARRALGLLAAEGRTEAHGGAGTFVRSQPQPAPVELLPEVQADARGVFLHRHAENWDLLAPTRIQREPAPLDVTGLLGLDPGTVMLVRDRVVGPPGGPPGQVATTYLPLDVVKALPRLGRADTGPQGFLALLEQARGRLHYTASVLARQPTPAEASTLQLPPGVPVLCLVRISYDHDQAVELTSYRLDSRRFVLTWPLVDGRPLPNPGPNPGPRPEPPGANAMGVLEPAHEDDLDD